MASQVPLRILCLDGGGVKGLSSLYILKELMAQIRRNGEPGNRQGALDNPRPCDYFDLICGTGTGGLLAIMLGRLRYDVESAIKTYISLASAVFESSRPEDSALFDSATLETEILRVIKTAPVGCNEYAMYEDPLVREDTRSCRTFVLAARPEGLGKTAVRMRSYATTNSDPFQAQIWQVARATSAAPSYFLPIDINGVRFGDSRIGWDNPTMEAINEASHVWPSRSIACVISVGTGLEEAIQLTNESRVPSISGMLGQLFGSLTPIQAFELAVAQYCVNCVTSCERTHEQVASSLVQFGIDGPYQYVRLNVPQGMAKIGMQEWKKIQMIAAMTEDYMEGNQVRELMQQASERLGFPNYYSVPVSATASIPNRRTMGKIQYAPAQRQIEARGSLAANLTTTSRNQESGRSNALIRPQIVRSRQQEGLKGERLESTSDESETKDRGGMKRSKVEVEIVPNSVPNRANRGRLRRSPKTRSSSPPVIVHPLPYDSTTQESNESDYGYNDDVADGNAFGEYFDNDGRSATVLCCDYPDCRSMGALQKDYLRDHYRTFHEEFLIRPSVTIPHAISSGSRDPYRCSACLRKLIDTERGQMCDSCQAFEPIRLAAMTENVPRWSSLEVKSASPSDPSLDSMRASCDTSPSTALTGSISEMEVDESLLPQSSVWTPPDLPEHWTSYTSNAPRRTEANTGYNRTHSYSSYRNPHTLPASVRKAREEYRRQRSYREKKQS